RQLRCLRGPISGVDRELLERDLVLGIIPSGAPREDRDCDLVPAGRGAWLGAARPLRVDGVAPVAYTIVQGGEDIKRRRVSLLSVRIEPHGPSATTRRLAVDKDDPLHRVGFADAGRVAAGDRGKKKARREGREKPAAGERERAR